MQSATVSSAPVTSWWYGQGRAVEVVRRLESLYALSPTPGPAGVVTARRDELTVTFVDGLKAPLPQPWLPGTGREARISWEAVDPATTPDPAHPVYLVVLGTTDDGALVGLNLAAFSRIRVEGDPATATALIARWVLELLCTHPDITIGVTADAWHGPLTSRVQPVAAGSVPDVDVLVCGPAVSYADRAQIIAASTSAILLDLGNDAAVSTAWVITCGPDRVGHISRSGSSSKPMTTTLIVPGADIVDRCAQMLISPTSPPTAPDGAGLGVDDDPVADDDAAVRATDGQDLGPDWDSALDSDDDTPADARDRDALGESIDFFASPTPMPAASPEPASGPGAPPAAAGVVDWADADPDLPAISFGDGAGPDPQRGDAPVTPAPAAGEPAAVDPAAAGPALAPIWNRILGRVTLSPPSPGQQPGPREKRLNELLVFLQHHPWASSEDIIRCVYGGAASDKTVTQQISLLRGRMGVVRPGGPKALPTMQEGGYHLDNAVRSDWMEFERLVEILVETTSTAHLVAAMDLVTGPPLGGIPPKEWAWANDLREELRDRVPAVALALAHRHYRAKSFRTAADTARKGLWYDNARQDLWKIALQAARDGHDNDGLRALRGQYLTAVAGPDRDPAVYELAGRSG